MTEAAQGEPRAATWAGTGPSEGDPAALLAQYRMVRTAVGVADRSDQVQIRMWGREPVKMLQGLITNDLAGAAPGHGVYAAMLTPKGRMVAELRAFALARDSGVQVLIDLPREALDGTVEHLRRYVPPMFARWEVDSSFRVLGVYGPRASEVLSALCESAVPPLEEDAFLELAVGGVPFVAVGTRYTGPEEGYDLFVPAPSAPALRASLLTLATAVGGGAIEQACVEALRIEAGRPRYGAELSEETIPTEAYESAGLMSRAISFGKGCYTGQEVIVRIAHRGHVNRHLRGIRLGASEAAPGISLLREDGKEMGRTTSATYSPLLGEAIALGFLRREISPGQRVRLGSPEGPLVDVCELPFLQPVEPDPDHREGPRQRMPE